MLSTWVQPVLAATDWEDIIKMIVALLVVGGGALSSLFTKKKDEVSGAPVETPQPPKRTRPQYPTAQPLPDESTPAGPPVIVMREEAPARPVITRPTAPPVVAESPIPTIRRPSAPVPRPVAGPAPRADKPTPVQKRTTVRRTATVDKTSDGSERGESRRVGKTQEKTELVRQRPKFEPTEVGERVREMPHTRSFNDTLRLASKESLRNAFLLTEILGPPLALRPIDKPFG